MQNLTSRRYRRNVRRRTEPADNQQVHGAVHGLQNQRNQHRQRKAQQRGQNFSVSKGHLLLHAIPPKQRRKLSGKPKFRFQAGLL